MHVKISFQAYADSKRPDQTAHPRSLIRDFAVCPFDVTVYIDVLQSECVPSLPELILRCPLVPQRHLFSQHGLLELLHSFGLRSV